MLAYANAEKMIPHLVNIAAVAPGARAGLTIDGAGWHETGNKLTAAPNLGLLHLPSYSPMLNPVENVWAYLRNNKLGKRVFDR